MSRKTSKKKGKVSPLEDESNGKRRVGRALQRHALETKGGGRTPRGGAARGVSKSRVALQKVSSKSHPLGRERVGVAKGRSSGEDGRARDQKRDVRDYVTSEVSAADIEGARREFFEVPEVLTADTPDYRDYDSSPIAVTKSIHPKDRDAGQRRFEEVVLRRLNTHDAGFEYMREQIKQMAEEIMNLQVRIENPGARSARF